MNFAVFDLETNGLKGSSVVSASSIVFDDRGHIRDFFNRFYFPTETPDYATEKIHGLTVERIHWFRQTEPYPLYFLEDVDALLSFWKKWHVSGIVVHNLAFDTSFLPRETVKDWKWWCSMIGLTNWCAIPNPKNAALYKWPRLNEAKMKTITHLKTPSIVKTIEDALPSEIGHYSLSDCFEMYGIFMRIWVSRPELVTFRHYKNRYIKPQENHYLMPLPTSPDIFVIRGLLFAEGLALSANLTEYAFHIRSLIDLYTLHYKVNV